VTIEKFLLGGKTVLIHKSRGGERGEIKKREEKAVRTKETWAF